MNKALQIFIIFLVSVISISDICYSKGMKTDSEVKASFIYNYLQFVEWPSNVRNRKELANICVMGNDPVIPYLQRMETNPPQTIPVKILIKAKSDPLEKCHILYVGSLYGDNADSVISRTKGLPILTVSDIKGFAKRGGITDFFMNNKKVELEANLLAIKNSGLVIDSELLEMMNIYNKTD